MVCGRHFLLVGNYKGDDDVCLILGDNFFYGHGLTDMLKRPSMTRQGKEGPCLDITSMTRKDMAL